jgi:pre-mRNA-splicing factor SYF1
MLMGLDVPQGSWGEAAKKLAAVVDDDTFRSLEGKSKHQLWLELCDIITRHPDLVRGMKVDAILRSGIRKFTDEVSICCVPVTQHTTSE